MDQEILLNVLPRLRQKASARDALAAALSSTAKGATHLTPAGNEPARCAAAQADTSTELPARSQAKRNGQRLTEIEFGLPDEARLFLLEKLVQCPLHCNYATLQRADGKFRVLCGGWYPNERSLNLDCPHNTPWLGSSGEAVRHWTLAIKLSL